MQAGNHPMSPVNQDCGGGCYNPASAASPMTVPRNWAGISVTALQRNFAKIRDFVAPNAIVCAVVKANAYGHGAAECAMALEQQSAKWFGVTNAEEGIQLRR